MRRPTRPTLFPYTTLFRSSRPRDGARDGERDRNAPPALAGAGARGARPARFRLANPRRTAPSNGALRSEEHTSELQSPYDLVCRLLLEKKNKQNTSMKLIT